MTLDIFKENNIELPTIEEADEIANPNVVAKFTNGDWNWYVVAGDKLKNNDYLLFGLVDGIYPELGRFTLSQLKEASAILTTDFDNIGVYDLKDKL